MKTENEQEYFQRLAYQEQHAAEFNELDYVRYLLKIALDAISFNLEHSKVIEARMQSDFFNINVNASEEIKRYLEPSEQSNICDPDELPF